MKKISFLIAMLAVILAFGSCSKSETYANQLDREKKAMNDYIIKHSINVITEEMFEKQGFTTDVTKNQYVLFKNTGVYMQIVDKGTGRAIQQGETATVLCRFREDNLLKDTLQLTNNVLYFGGKVDKMSVTNTSGTYTASFETASVPAGWLVPLPYIKIGRITSATSTLAHVKLIVPSQQGQIDASSNVYPCFYDITYQRGF